MRQSNINHLPSSTRSHPPTSAERTRIVLMHTSSSLVFSFFVGISSADYAQAPAEVVDQFDAFAAGWNRHLADGGLDGWCADAEWVRPVEAVEVYAYARSVALLASGANLTEYIASAQPPTPASDEAAPAPAAVEPDFSALVAPDLGSNAWAIGANRIEGGTGSALVANPDTPWEGARRFTEVHLVVPGEIDIYGAQLAGVPGVAIGFTADVAWSHTGSSGHRFTAYTLDLDPASPTSYFVDGVSVPMTASDHTVEILRPDGTIDSETRTLYHSEFGPIIDAPGRQLRCGGSSERQPDDTAQEQLENSWNGYTA